MIMKKNIITILFALVTMVGQAQVPLESVKELTMKSKYFNHERQVLIYMPNNYPNFDQTYYDVIYVFDAQDRTMFDLVHCLLNIACKPDPRRRQEYEFHHRGHLLANPLGHQLFPQPRLPAHAPAWQHWTVQGGLLLRQIARPEEIRQE